MNFTHTHQRRFAFTGILAVVVAAWANVSAAADIALRSQASPRGAVVRLGDVADVRAENDQDARRLTAMPLMPTPALGTQRFLRMREVQDMLAAHGENMSRLTFRGEQVVEIGQLEPQGQPINSQPATAGHAKRRDAWLTSDSTASAAAQAAQLTATRADELRDQLSQTIVDQLNRSSGQPSNWQVKIKVTDRDLRTLAAANSGLKCTGGSTPWTGKQRFTVSFTTPAGEAQLTVPADVTLPQSVIVATQPIERGAIVTAADVELRQSENVPAAQGRHVAVDSIEKLVGMETARPIQAGQMIFADDVRSPLLVKRGDEVAVYARGGGIQVRTRARAKEDGARGDLVQVESLETRDIYDAVVVGQREAAVFAGNDTPITGVAERSPRKARR